MQLDSLQRRPLVWAGLAVVLTAFDGSVLVLALPAIAGDFHARVPALSNLGSVLALGGLGALPLATLADRFGPPRLIAGGGGGFNRPPPKRSPRDPESTRLNSHPRQIS